MRSWCARCADKSGGTCRAVRPRELRATLGTAFMWKSWRGRRTTSQHGLRGRTGGHPSRLFMRGGVTPCWPRFGARHLSPVSLPCRNLAHIMLAAIYKHDFKPAIAIGVACTPPPPPPLPAPIYRSTFVFMTDSRCFFGGLSDIFVNARVSGVLLVGTLTWSVTNAGTMFVSGFDRRITLPLPFLVLYVYDTHLFPLCVTVTCSRTLVNKQSHQLNAVNTQL